MADYRIKIIGYASGNYCAPDIANKYVRTFDHEAFNGRGFLTCTPDPDQALRFPDQITAFEFWRKVPSCRPRREDGKENRPMTAFTTMIEPAHERATV